MRQPFFSAKRLYIRNKSPAKIPASSPPAPARISKKQLRSSFGSFGSNRICSSSVRRSIAAFAALISSCAISRISASSSCAISSAATRSSFACW
ncbi:Uncharacterised protein [Vibrio cholerae]|nr:Uncharacterised protein [Vibrio cholerae]CSC87268.1 Uncharacterised protein [Vibrio cholerae]